MLNEKRQGEIVKMYMRFKVSQKQLERYDLWVLKTTSRLAFLTHFWEVWVRKFWHSHLSFIVEKVRHLSCTLIRLPLLRHQHIWTKLKKNFGFEKSIFKIYCMVSQKKDSLFKKLIYLNFFFDDRTKKKHFKMNSEQFKFFSSRHSAEERGTSDWLD